MESNVGMNAAKNSESRVRLQCNSLYRVHSTQYPLQCLLFINEIDHCSNLSARLPMSRSNDQPRAVLTAYLLVLWLELRRE